MPGFAFKLYTMGLTSFIIVCMTKMSDLQTMPFSPVESETIAQRLIGEFAQSLIRGDLKPGDRLPPEPELAESLGVSRTVLREALKTLAGLGVIKSKRRGGTYIATSISEGMLNPLIFSLIIEKGSKEELMELRMLLEVDAVELAMEKAEEDELEQLAEELREFEVRIADGDFETLSELDVRFHLRILDMTKNPAFIRIGRTIMHLFAFPIGQALKVLGPEQVLRNHRELLEIIRRKDLPAAREHIRKSFAISMN